MRATPASCSGAQPRFELPDANERGPTLGPQSLLRLCDLVAVGAPLGRHDRSQLCHPGNDGLMLPPAVGSAV